MSATATHTDLTLNVLRGEANGLIRDEIRAAEQRERLNRGVRDAILKLGVSINEVSAATGLTIEDIRTVIDQTPVIDDDLAVLAGVS